MTYGILAFTLALLVPFLFWPDYIMIYFLGVASFFGAYISYLDVKAARESNLGLSFLKRYQKARSIYMITLLFELVVAAFYVFSILTHVLVMAGNSWRRYIIDLESTLWGTDIQKMEAGWSEYTFNAEFQNLAGTVLPYLFVVINLMVLFYHVIPLVTFDRIARRRYIVLLFSFIAGNIIAFIVSIVVPLIFYLDKNSLVIILSIMFLGYISSEILESDIEKVILEIKCEHCGENNPIEAEYCMFCGKKF